MIIRQTGSILSSQSVLVMEGTTALSLISVLLTLNFKSTFASSLVTIAVREILTDLSSETDGGVLLFYLKISRPSFTQDNPSELEDLLPKLSDLYIPTILLTSTPNASLSQHRGLTRLCQTVVTVQEGLTTTRVNHSPSAQEWYHHMNHAKFIFLPSNASISPEKSYHSRRNSIEVIKSKLELVLTKSHVGLDRLLVMARCTHCQRQMHLIRAYGHSENETYNVIRYREELYPDFTKNFHSTLFTALIGFTQKNPFTTVIDENMEEEMNVGLKALRFIGQHLNFSVNLKFFPVVQYRQMGINVHQEYARELTRERFTVGIGSTPKSVRSNSQLQTSRPYLTNYLAMLLKLQNKIGSWTTPIVIINEEYQGAVGLAVILLSTLVVTLELLGSIARRKYLKFSTQMFMKGYGKAMHLLTRVVFLQHSVNKFSKYTSWAARGILYYWWIFSWGTIWYHQATLTSKLTIPEQEPELKRLADFYNPEKPEFLSWALGTTISKPPPANLNGTRLENVWRNTEYVRSFDTCIHRILTRNHYVCAHTKPQLELWVKAVPPNVQRKLLIRLTGVSPLVATYVVTKDFLYLDELDGKLQRLIEAGLLDRWNRDRQGRLLMAVEEARTAGIWNASFSSLFSAVGTNDKNAHTMTVTHIIASFMVVYTVAAMAFLVELIWFYWKSLSRLVLKATKILI